MNRRLAKVLTLAYPAWWRERYAKEFAVFLEDSDTGIRNLPGVIWSAIQEHFIVEGELGMNSLQRALGLVVLSFLAAASGGVNLVMTVDDSSLVAATRMHPITSMAWNVLAMAAIFSGVAVLFIAIALYRSILAYAWRNRRMAVIARLAVPFVGLGLLVLWGAGCMALTHGRWAPSPWAILGNGSAPTYWPSLSVRWICGVVSVVLIVAVALASAVCVAQAIRLAHFEYEGEERYRRQRRSAVYAGLLVSGCALVMFSSVLIWGVSIAQNSPGLLHQSVGLLDGPATASWATSLLLFGLASLISFRASQNIRKAQMVAPQ